MEYRSYTLGRLPDNDIIISYPQVSKKHAIITEITPNQWLIEDQASSGGTFVNGQKIHRTLFKLGDKVKLANIQLDINKHLFKGEKAKAPKSGNDYCEEFLKLKEVYESYQKAQKKIKTTKELSKLSGYLIYGTAILADVATYGFAGLAVGILASKVLAPEDKLLAIKREFELSYVCPKCLRSLRGHSWESLSFQKQCIFRCGAVWNNN